MDGGAWWAAVHGVTKSQTWLSDFTFTFHFHALEKEMATHSSVLCLENPRDRGAWWAAVYGVAQSRIWLKRLSSNSSSSSRELHSEVNQTKANMTWYRLYMEFFFKYKKNLFTKQKYSQRHRKQIYGINQEFGINVYTLHACMCAKSFESCPTLSPHGL